MPVSCQRTKKSNPGIQCELAAKRTVRRPGMPRITILIQTDEVECRSEELVRVLPQRIHDSPLFRMHTAGLVGHLAIISCLVSRTAPLALPLPAGELKPVPIMHPSFAMTLPHRDRRHDA